MVLMRSARSEHQKPHMQILLRKPARQKKNGKNKKQSLRRGNRAVENMKNK